MSKCNEAKMQDLSVGDFISNTATLGKANGMDATCQQKAKSSGANFAASANLDTPIGSAGAQISGSQYDSEMEQAGCGTFISDIKNQLNSVAQINCTIKSNQTSVSNEQFAGNSITLKTLPLSDREQANLDNLTNKLFNAQMQAMTIATSSKLSNETVDLLKKINSNTISAIEKLIANYNRDINIRGSQITQSINQSMTSSISLSTSQTDSIVSSQKMLAEATAENKIKQELGFQALSPNIKSLINSNTQNSSLFSNQSVNEIVNSIKLSQSGSNNIVIECPGSIDLEDTVISQSLVQDMVVKAIVADAVSSGTQIATDMLNSASSKLVAEGSSKGADALVQALGEANANAIKAGKVSYGGGAIFAVIIVLFFVVGFGAVKSAGSMMMNNAVLIMGIVAIVAGIIYATKSGVGNKILGVIMVVLGVVGLGFGAMLRMRASAMPLQFRFQ